MGLKGKVITLSVWGQVRACAPDMCVKENPGNFFYFLLLWAWRNGESGTYVQGGRASWTGIMLLCLPSALGALQTEFGTHKNLSIYIYSCINIQLKFDPSCGKYTRDLAKVVMMPSILSFTNEWKKLKPCRGPLVMAEFEMWSKRSLRDYHFLLRTPSCHLSKTTLALEGFLTDVLLWEKTKAGEDIIQSGWECGGGVRVSGCDAVTAARDWDYKPWITRASTQKHKSTVGFGPGPAFT